MTFQKVLDCSEEMFDHVEPHEDWGNGCKKAFHRVVVVVAVSYCFYVTFRHFIQEQQEEIRKQKGRKTPKSKKL